MKKYTFILALIFLVPTISYSAHALIWEYDTLDIFYDPARAESVDCPHNIEKALTNNGHTFETYPYLPADLTPYDVVFVTTGWVRC